LELIHLMQHECVGDTPWTRGTIHVRHMIRQECVGDTPWSRGNVYMRTDIYGTSELLADGMHSDLERALKVLQVSGITLKSPSIRDWDWP
jgi:hypothetical protein